MQQALWRALGVLSVMFLHSCATTGEHLPVREKSLYERLGGKPVLTAVVDDFTARVAADHRINHFFARTDLPSWRAKLVDQLCEASGGPCKYTGATMPAAQQGMGIADADFEMVVEDLAITLDKFKVPAREKDELRAVIGPLRKDIVAR